MLFSWRGLSSGPEARKEDCGMGKSDQSQVTKLTDVLTHNLLPCQADMQQTNQKRWLKGVYGWCNDIDTQSFIIIFFWFKWNEPNTKLMWIQFHNMILLLNDHLVTALKSHKVCQLLLNENISAIIQ